MTSFNRKLKRKQGNAFRKAFKKTMKDFKRMVKCSKCSRQPSEGEKIDNWRMEKSEDSISLTCLECYEQEENQDV